MTHRGQGGRGALAVVATLALLGVGAPAFGAGAPTWGQTVRIATAGETGEAVPDPTATSPAATQTATSPAATQGVEAEDNKIQAGQMLTLEGQGWIKGETVTFTLTRPGEGEATVTALTRTTTAQEADWSYDLLIPRDTEPGKYTLTVTGSQSQRPLTIPMTVLAHPYSPGIVADPASVPAGQTLVVTGTGFAPSEKITISGIGDPVTRTSTADGALKVDLPVAATQKPGQYTLSALGKVSDRTTTALVGVTDALEPGPDDTPPPATTAPATTPPATTAAPPAITIPPPASSAPPATTPAPTPTPSATTRPTGPQPLVTLEVDTLRPGETLTILGSKFTAGEKVALEVTGSTLATSATAATDGRFTARLTLPKDWAPGVYGLTALGAKSAVQAATVFSVTDSPYRPKVVVRSLDGSSLTSLVLGQEVMVIGTGFPAKASGVIEMHSDPVRLAEITTDEIGAFAQSVTVPREATLGAHRIVARVAGIDETPIETFTTLIVRGQETPADNGDDGTGSIPGEDPEDPAGDSTPVEPRPTTASTGTLPMTGTQVAPVALGALIMLIVGASTLAFRNRRAARR